MAYNFKTDDKGKSFEMKLDDETILTAFVTEDSDSGLPEVADGYYGGIGAGAMSGDWTPAGGGGGDLTTVEITIKNTTGTPQTIGIPFTYDSDQISASSGTYMAPAGTSTVNAVLYKDITIMIPASAGYLLSVESGSAEMVGTNVKITGECVIDVTQQSS